MGTQLDWHSTSISSRPLDLLLESPFGQTNWVTDNKSTYYDNLHSSALGCTELVRERVDKRCGKTNRHPMVYKALCDQAMPGFCHFYHMPSPITPQYLPSPDFHSLLSLPTSEATAHPRASVHYVPYAGERVSRNSRSLLLPFRGITIVTSLLRPSVTIQLEMPSTLTHS